MKSLVKKILKWCYLVKGYFSGNIGGYLFKLNPQNTDFWRQVSKNKWEPETITTLSKFLTPESIYCDIGAWIGPTVLYASKKCKKVICFEPNPVAFKYLTTNLHTNNINNVDAFNVAISNKKGSEKMASFGGTMGDSMSSLLPNILTSSDCFEASVLDWDSAETLYNLADVNMIKMDIEGSEFSLIPAMKNYLNTHKPILWLSTHAALLPENERVSSMKTIVNVLSCYKSCFDANLNPISINELLSEKTLKDNFATFLFKD